MKLEPIEQPTAVGDEEAPATPKQKLSAVTWGLHVLIATLPDGSRVRIRRERWDRCWVRAKKLGAVRVVDGAGTIWESFGATYKLVGMRSKPKPVIIKRKSPLIARNP